MQARNFLYVIALVILLCGIGYSVTCAARYIKEKDSNTTIAVSSAWENKKNAENTKDTSNGLSDGGTGKDAAMQFGKPKTYMFPGTLSSERIDNKRAIFETSKGVIEIELKSKEAPLSVSNFVYLIEEGYYNNLTFHRVEPGFVIQGGDPLGNGRGGPGYQFPDEPVQGDYVTGAVAMANAGPNTNGSQFFICLDDLASLPKQYNLFGQVTKGMEVVQSIKVGDKIIKATVEDK